MQRLRDLHDILRCKNARVFVPNHASLSPGSAYSPSSGKRRSTSRIDDRRWQALATYTRGDTRLAARIDDRGEAGYGSNRVPGATLSHQADALYLATKYEAFKTGNRQTGSSLSDGNRAVNLNGLYAPGKSTITLILAKVENYGHEIIHLGIDFALSSQCKLFSEMYHDAETAALAARRSGQANVDAAYSGRRAIAVGLRDDF